MLKTKEEKVSRTFLHCPEQNQPATVGKCRFLIIAILLRNLNNIVTVLDNAQIRVKLRPQLMALKSVYHIFKNRTPFQMSSTFPSVLTRKMCLNWMKNRHPCDAEQ